MKQLGQRLLYCDTDSIILLSIITDENEYVPKLVNFLGEFTDEVGGGNWINDETVCKVKGFTLNYKASTILNMDKNQKYRFK